MATATIPLKGSASMESKKVSISSKRQITIPQKFFTLLGFNTEASFPFLPSLCGRNFDRLH